MRLLFALSLILIITSCIKRPQVKVSGYLVVGGDFGTTTPLVEKSVYVEGYCANPGMFHNCSFDTIIATDKRGRISFTYSEGIEWLELWVSSDAGYPYHAYLVPDCNLLNQTFRLKSNPRGMDLQGDCMGEDVSRSRMSK